jgi:hypothetical protein
VCRRRRRRSRVRRVQRRYRTPIQGGLQGLKVEVIREVVAGVVGGVEHLERQVVRGVPLVEVEVGVRQMLQELALAEVVGMHHLLLLGVLSLEVWEVLLPFWI